MGKTKLTRGNIFRCDKKTVLLVFLAFIFISLASASSIATPVIMSNSGSNVRNKVSGDLVNNGDLIVSVYNESTGGTPIYSEEFQDVIDNGSWNVILGTNGDLDLEYQTRYYIDYDINGEDIDFRNNEGSTGKGGPLILLMDIVQSQFQIVMKEKCLNGIVQHLLGCVQKIKMKV